MKAGVCSYCFNPLITAGKMTMMEAIEFVGKETEAECFEPYSPFWDPDRDLAEQAREAGALMKSLGLQASNHALMTDFAVYDDAQNRACIERCVEWLDITRLLGADTVRLDPRTSPPAGKKMDDLDADDVIPRIAESMQQVVDIAAENGMTAGVENHGRLLGRTAQTARIVDLVDRPNFGVNLDFTNFRHVFGEDHIQAVRQFADRVVHVHAKDFHISAEPKEEAGWMPIPSGEYIKRAVGGEGDMQWPLVFQILKDAGYNGAICLEVSDPADIKGSVAKGVANIKRIIAQVEGR